MLEKLAKSPYFLEYILLFFGMKSLPKLIAKKPAATKKLLVFQKTKPLKDLLIQITLDIRTS